MFKNVCYALLIIPSLFILSLFMLIQILETEK